MSQYIHHATVAIPRVMELIKENYNTSGARVDVHGFSVGVTSLRLRTFRRAHKCGKMYCMGCNVQASFFSIDSFKNSSQNSYHLNLYAKGPDGNILMTHDHRIARSLGGADNISNTTMMCSPCNGKKSRTETSLINERRFIDTHIEDPEKKAVANKAWAERLEEYKARWAHLTT
jgi:5-methylcytosine-specific restriction endonuclease McrA